jgi:membrane associated rhomboid family serine protease
MMGDGFNKFTEGIAWLQIAASPTLTGVIIGFVIGLAGNTGLGIVVGLFGLIIGILWALRVSKKEGTNHFMSRTMATPELDEKEPVQKKESN